MDYAPVFRKLGVPRNLSFLGGGGYPGNAPKRGDTKMAKNDPPNLTTKMPSKNAPKNPIPGNPKNPISWGGGGGGGEGGEGGGGAPRGPKTPKNPKNPKNPQFLAIFGNFQSGGGAKKGQIAL
jgi:hypothetical protein